MPSHERVATFCAVASDSDHAPVSEAHVWAPFRARAAALAEVAHEALSPAGAFQRGPGFLLCLS